MRRPTSAAAPRPLISNIADIVEVETLRVAKSLVVGVGQESPLARIFGLGAGLIFLAPAELRFQE